MTATAGYSGSQRPRQAILGQLPRINRADGSPIRVLLVDDEPALTNLVKMALHYEGWVVDIAHNGREAMAKFERVNPDVLVLDIMLPDVDGLRILERVRQSDVYTPTLFPDRARLGHGPGDRPDRGRRRLHDQTVQPGGIGR